MAEDYYEVLGVTKDASSQEIKKAFRAIAKECHPDVAGPDPLKARRFKQAKEAYEALGDDASRARYDRRQERRARRASYGGGSTSFREAFYRRAAGEPAGGPSANPANQRTRRRVNDPGNNLDLDDLFNDFGFGRPPGGGRPGRNQGGGRNTANVNAGGRPRGGARPSQGPSPGRGSAGRAHPPSPQPGRDVSIDLDVPEHIARDGGTVTAVYYRMQRSDSWRPGSPEPGVVRIQDLADIRLLPGTSNGEVLHEKGKGDAGTFGGPYGDLIVRVRIVPSPMGAGAGRKSTKSSSATSGAEQAEDQVVDISVTEAILGARVEVPTPEGEVLLSVPPGTSSGARMRLKGKGARSRSGAPTDLYVRLRIVVPKELDAESRDLIERFGRLNPVRR
ncbi:MAG: J domain-containing protein [Deltaproteobacteria bacterium]|nr:MAG: J domain-containing protein [Deltaproteobacteria bacterium]